MVLFLVTMSIVLVVCIFEARQNQKDFDLLKTVLGAIVLLVPESQDKDDVQEEFIDFIARWSREKQVLFCG